MSDTGVDNISLFQDPQAAAILRQQKMAELLQQQALSPIEVQSYKGVQAPIHPLSVLAKVLQGYMSGRQQDKADEAAGAYRTQQNDAFTKAVSGFGQPYKTTDTAPPTEATAAQDTATGEPLQQYTMKQPTSQENLASAANIAGMPGVPGAAAVGGALMGATTTQMKEDTAFNRSLPGYLQLYTSAPDAQKPLIGALIQAKDSKALEAIALKSVPQAVNQATNIDPKTLGIDPKTLPPGAQIQKKADGTYVLFKPSDMTSQGRFGQEVSLAGATTNARVGATIGATLNALGMNGAGGVPAAGGVTPVSGMPASPVASNAPQAGAKQPTPAAPKADLTGDAYLATLKPDFARVVKSIANGDQSVTGFSRNPAVQMQLRKAVTAYDPGFSELTMPVRKAFATSFANGDDGKAVTSFSTFASHLDRAQPEIAALKNGNIQLINSWAQAYAKQTGQAAPTNWQQIGTLLGDEQAKAIIGTRNAEADRKTISGFYSNINSPDQLIGAFDKARGFAADRLQSQKIKYEAGTKFKNFNDFLSPSAKNLLVNFPSPGTPGGPAMSGNSGGGSLQDQAAAILKARKAGKR